VWADSSYIAGAENPRTNLLATHRPWNLPRILFITLFVCAAGAAFLPASGTSHGSTLNEQHYIPYEGHQKPATILFFDNPDRTSQALKF